jgi:hypothetical protein
MSIEFLESFGQYGAGTYTSSAGFEGVWSLTGEWKISDLGGGRKAVYSDYYSTAYLDHGLSTSYSTIIIGFRLHTTALEALALVQCYDSGSCLGTIGMTAGGQINFSASAVPGLNVRLTSTASLGAATHVTVKIVFSDTVGEVYIYFDGILDSSATSVDTISAGTACNMIRLGKTAGSAKFSDLYIESSTVHGDRNVAWDSSDTSGVSSDYTPTGDTNNEDCVDEVPSDDDTTYNRSTTSTDKDSLGHSSPPSMATVVAVQEMVRARKEDANDGSIKVGTRYSSNESQSASLSLDTSYKYVWEIFEDVPGGSGWTAAEVEAAESSYENVSV